jgi:hypothetical protein
VVVFMAALILITGAPDEERASHKLEVPAPRSAAETATLNVRQRETIEYFREWTIRRACSAAVVEYAQSRREF